jgi:hypothetical protein
MLKMIDQKFIDKMNELCVKYNFIKDYDNLCVYYYHLWMYGGKTTYDLPGVLQGCSNRISPMVSISFEYWENKYYICYSELVPTKSKTGCILYPNKDRKNILKMEKFDWDKFEKWLIKQNDLIKLSIKEAKTRIVQNKLNKAEKDFK